MVQIFNLVKNEIYLRLLVSNTALCIINYAVYVLVSYVLFWELNI